MQKQYLIPRLQHLCLSMSKTAFTEIMKSRLAGGEWKEGATYWRYSQKMEAGSDVLEYQYFFGKSEDAPLYEIVVLFDDFVDVLTIASEQYGPFNDPGRWMISKKQSGLPFDQRVVVEEAMYQIKANVKNTPYSGLEDFWYNGRLGQPGYFT